MNAVYQTWINKSNLSETEGKVLNMYNRAFTFPAFLYENVIFIEFFATFNIEILRTLYIRAERSRKIKTNRINFENKCIFAYKFFVSLLHVCQIFATCLMRHITPPLTWPPWYWINYALREYFWFRIHKQKLFFDEKFSCLKQRNSFSDFL